MPHPASIEHRRSFHQGLPNQNREDLHAQKAKLAAGPGGYRTRAGYRKVNQSTSNIQMSSALSNFSGTQGLNPKRVRKATGG